MKEEKYAEILSNGSGRCKKHISYRIRRTDSFPGYTDPSGEGRKHIGGKKEKKFLSGISRIFL